MIFLNVLPQTDLNQSLGFPLFHLVHRMPCTYSARLPGFPLFHLWFHLMINHGSAFVQLNHLLSIESTVSKTKLCYFLLNENDYWLQSSFTNKHLKKQLALFDICNQNKLKCSTVTYRRRLFYECSDITFSCVTNKEIILGRGKRCNYQIIVIVIVVIVVVIISASTVFADISFQLFSILDVQYSTFLKSYTTVFLLRSNVTIEDATYPVNDYRNF